MRSPICSMNWPYKYGEMGLAVLQASILTEIFLEAHWPSARAAREPTLLPPPVSRTVFSASYLPQNQTGISQTARLEGRLYIQVRPQVAPKIVPQAWTDGK